MTELDQRQEEIIEEFSFYDNWMDKYSHLIEQGNELEAIDSNFKTDENLLKGCQSKVWIEAKGQDGLVIFKGDSDSAIVKGIVALIIRVFSSLPPDDILNAELHFIEKSGLKEHLSPSRNNGLFAMIKQMKLYALVIKNQSSL